MLGNVATVISIITDICFIVSIVSAFIPKVRQRFADHMAIAMYNVARMPRPESRDKLKIMNQPPSIWDEAMKADEKIAREEMTNGEEDKSV